MHLALQAREDFSLRLVLLREGRVVLLGRVWSYVLPTHKTRRNEEPSGVSGTAEEGEKPGETTTKPFHQYLKPPSSQIAEGPGNTGQN